MYDFYHHSTQTMTLVSVSGTGSFCCVPERMMKKKTSFYRTVNVIQLLTVFYFGRFYYYENVSIFTEPGNL